MILPHDPSVSNPEQYLYEICPVVEVVDLRLVDPRQRYLRAVASVRYGGQVVRGVRVVQLRGRLAVQMPESRAAGGVWEPMIVIEAPALKAAINDALLEAFKLASTCRGLAK